MSADDFTTAAHALGVDPEEVRASVGNAFAHHLKVGMSDEEVLMWMWHAGAIYGRDHLAAQMSTAAEIEVAAESLARHQRPTRTWAEVAPSGKSYWRGQARAALSAVRRRHS